MRPEADVVVRGEDRLLTLVQVFQAPRAPVWTAWTAPAMLARWKGPRGFTAIAVDSATARDDHQGGWTGAFDKLAEALAASA